MKIRRIVSVFLLAVLMSILCLPPLPYADEPLDIQAKAALLVDGSSGRVLYAKNEHEELYPASITKVTTALLVFEAIERGDLRLDQTVTVSASALAGQDPDGSTAGIKEGEQLTVEELLYCMLVVSANEACSILAEAVSGSVDAFVEQMNQRVQELGCVNTHYVNDSGLHDPQHYSSAWDIYLITREAMKYDEFMTIVNSKSYTVPATNLSEARELHSTNALISTWRMLGYYYSGAQGIKTGSTSDAGNCLVSSAVRGSRRLVGVVLGADTVTDAGGSRKVMSFVEMARMFDYGFDNFTSQTVLKSDEAVMEVPVALSKETNYVVVHPAEKLDALLPKDASADDITRSITLTSETANAPIKKGDVLGEITILYKGEPCASTQLLAQYDVSASRFLLAKYKVVSFLSRTVVKICIALLVVLIAGFIFWLRVVHPKRRYGGRRSRSYFHRSYRGRGRR